MLSGVHVTATTDIYTYCHTLSLHDALPISAATDAVYAASGPAAFAYGLPHDHSFHFLTTGYWGPGYVSDDYDYDPESVDGRLGEPMAANFVGRSRLSGGWMILYRAHRGIHSNRQIGRTASRESGCQNEYISVDG